MGSSRVLEKIGMLREGFLREHRWMNGHWRNSLLYAVLERDWREYIGRMNQHTAAGTGGGHRMSS